LSLGAADLERRQHQRTEPATTTGVIHPYGLSRQRVSRPLSCRSREVLTSAAQMSLDAPRE
jgi:hypothetical protein